MRERSLHDTIHVTVEYYDGREEGDVGYPYFVASCDEIAAVTDARTLDELLQNIQEVITAHLEVAGESSGVVQNPKILVQIELPIHAQAA